MKLVANKIKWAGPLLLLLVNVVMGQEEVPPPWARFEPEGAGFSVLMPGKPQETITKRPNYTLHTFSVTWGRGTYVATYSDYTAEAKLDPNTALIKNRDKFNKSFDAKLISSREITLDGHTGLEFTSESPAVNLKSQLFLIGNRMYQTATMVFKDADQTTGVERFFSSFKFSPEGAKTQRATDPPLTLRLCTFAETYLITPCSGLDALAYKRFGMRPARYASRPA
jgi:hypothetical protein